MIDFGWFKTEGFSRSSPLRLCSAAAASSTGRGLLGPADATPGTSSHHNVSR
jgi:hypothetical protein